MSIKFKLVDESGLPGSTAHVWVAGWINGGSQEHFKVLEGSNFTRPSTTKAPTSVPFQKLSDVSDVVLEDKTNGDDRFLFVVSKDKPQDLTITNNNPIQYTQYPYANTPGVEAPGPFDVFEFGLDAQLNLSAVSGFGLNLRFDVEGPDGPQYGMRKDVTRSQIAEAFTKFMKNEAKTDPAAAHFLPLLYSTPLTKGGFQPPIVDNQFFAICDPNDWLASKSGNYQKTTDDPLATYWDETLDRFFSPGNVLSINLGSKAAPRLYEGSCTTQARSGSTKQTQGYTLTGPAGTFHFYKPESGLQSSQYVFQQSFGVDLTPAGAAGDAGLLQDCIWEALCRGVALDGVLTAEATESAQTAFSTSKWNDWSKWYQAGKTCHYYSKFLHYSDSDGNDTRLSGKPSLMLNQAAYGFSMDENPVGPYDGPEVPSKTTDNVKSGTVTITVGKWT
ncbi:hypothetical protein SAMN04488518_103163 [Pseudovibrio ascidiaceicola]|uniref:Beta-1,3-glucanase N-terminal domain-containing protein n=1 Tax=Pseudovibrio ascidiaceicola TaxID=285279 RepID=A0A1I3XUM6_9HYPH|nr:hypothetical protein [Pseudovibrio ascidiaceicola]SFK23245.1 hypothetical protein SAMN04488518_103163 [Pseudovibrio ascidiaceicola]